MKETQANEKPGDEVAAEPLNLGAKRALRKALKGQLNDNGASLIARALVDQTVKGDLHCAEMLMSLVDREKDGDGKARKKKKRSGPSFAELLASGPKWVDPEPADEQEMGSREPEGGSF